MISVASVFRVINTIDWNAKGSLSYSEDQFSFYVSYFIFALLRALLFYNYF